MYKFSCLFSVILLARVNPVTLGYYVHVGRSVPWVTTAPVDVDRMKTVV